MWWAPLPDWCLLFKEWWGCRWGRCGFWGWPWLRRLMKKRRWKTLFHSLLPSCLGGTCIYKHWLHPCLQIIYPHWNWTKTSRYTRQTVGQASLLYSLLPKICAWNKRSAYPYQTFSYKLSTAGLGSILFCRRWSWFGIIVLGWGRRAGIGICYEREGFGEGSLREGWIIRSPEGLSW